MQSNLHVIATFTVGGYARLYINGQLAASSYYTYPTMPYANVFYLGKSLSPYNPYMVGSIDEFRIWGGAIGQADALSSFLAGPSKFYLQ